MCLHVRWRNTPGKCAKICWPWLPKGRKVLLLIKQKRSVLMEDRCNFELYLDSRLLPTCSIRRRNQRTILVLAASIYGAQLGLLLSYIFHHRPCSAEPSVLDIFKLNQDESPSDCRIKCELKGFRVQKKCNFRGFWLQGWTLFRLFRLRGCLSYCGGGDTLF